MSYENGSYTIHPHLYWLETVKQAPTTADVVALPQGEFGLYPCHVLSEAQQTTTSHYSQGWGEMESGNFQLSSWNTMHGGSPTRASDAAFLFRIIMWEPWQTWKVTTFGASSICTYANGEMFAGHYAFGNIHTLQENISTSQTTFNVSNASNVVNANDYILVSATGSPAAPDFSTAERVNVSSHTASSVTVSRAVMSTNSNNGIAFSTGDYFMELEGMYDNTPHYNWSLECPTDGAGRRFIDAVVNTVWTLDQWKTGTDGTVRTAIVPSGALFDIDYWNMDGTRGRDYDLDGTLEEGVARAGHATYNEGDNFLGFGVWNLYNQLAGLNVNGGGCLICLGMYTAMDWPWDADVDATKRAPGVANGTQFEGWLVNEGNQLDLNPSYPDIDGLFALGEMWSRMYSRNPTLNHTLDKAGNATHPSDRLTFRNRWTNLVQKSTATSGTTGTTLTDSTKDFTALGVTTSHEVYNLTTGASTSISSVGTTTLQMSTSGAVAVGNEYNINNRPLGITGVRNKVLMLKDAMAMCADIPYVCDHNNTQSSYEERSYHDHHYVYCGQSVAGSYNWGEGVGRNNLEDQIICRGWLGAPKGRTFDYLAMRDHASYDLADAVMDHDFTAGLNSWSGVNCTVAHDGTENAMKISRTASSYSYNFSGEYAQSSGSTALTTTNGKRYIVCVQARLEDTKFRLWEMRMRFTSGQAATISDLPMHNEYRWYVTQFTATGGGTDAQFYIHLGKSYLPVFVKRVVVFERDNHAGAFFRQFENGLVLANRSDQTVTYPIYQLTGSLWHEIERSDAAATDGPTEQDPDNRARGSGSVHRTYTLGPKDGIFLVRPQ